MAHEKIGTHTHIATRRGALALPASEAELHTWDFETCRQWLAQNDPNGEWSPDACAEYETTVADMRGEIWAQLEDFR